MLDQPTGPLYENVNRVRNYSTTRNRNSPTYSPPRRRDFLYRPLVGIKSILFESSVPTQECEIQLAKRLNSNTVDFMDKLGKGLNDIKSKYIDFKSYSCNCELIRLNDKGNLIRML